MFPLVITDDPQLPEKATTDVSKPGLLLLRPEQYQPRVDVAESDSYFPGRLTAESH